MIVILLVYHLIQNRTLAKRINARTIALSPLAVAVSVLAGLQLLGFLGVLLAIPAAGVINVVIRDLWEFRRRKAAPAAPAPVPSGGFGYGGLGDGQLRSSRSRATSSTRSSWPRSWT